MFSIIQAKLKLPMDFIENLYKIFGTKVADKILNGMLQNRNTTLRVNTLKCTKEDLEEYLEKNNIEFENIDWYEDAFVVKNVTERELQKLDFYEKGCFYIQGLSSMVPPLILEPERGESILDLTAAPGSKTTQIAAIMKNAGYILANELDKIRCEKLKYNINMQGAKIVEVVNEKGQDIGIKYPGKFDRVLLDTPCSGEGRFLISDSKTYNNWSKKMVEELSKIQKELLKSAVSSLKPNGILVYSTCTLNKEENEKILDWGIKELGITMLDIPIKIKNSIKADNKGLDKSIDKAMKILPTKNMEGFFVAKITR